MNIPMKVRINQERAEDEERAGAQELGVIEDPSHHQGQGQQDAPSSGRPIMDTPGAASFHHPGQPKLQRDLTTLNVLKYFFQNIPKAEPRPRPSQASVPLARSGGQRLPSPAREVTAK
ncbi:unnamed protein product [Rangifer tarandus platyrhynchus]|uniref:Uncharacterized protein n=1 Tax=Rangifer tarandus platyrhynchus TaxID=3082113 RepID=A0AC59Y3L4_RANTA